MMTRRTLLRSTALTAAAFTLQGKAAWANPLGLPAGLQLYSVREQMAQDLDGALAAVHAAGYTEVESASLPKKPAKEIRASLDKAGLRCVSAHYGFADVTTRFDETAAYAKELGCTYLICPSTPKRDGSAPGKSSPMTLDDWRNAAEQFNKVGEKANGVGLHFGYHNHTGEFIPLERTTPYAELLRLTDPAKVTFEMDAGWVKVAGADPVQLMQQYPHRFSMLHVKDFKLATNPQPDKREESKVTELGMGSIDFHPLFAQAAKNQHITHAFVEQEAFDMPWQQSLKVDADYWHKLQA
ncbi:sugar phosphate isomerase/epimerase family protein [Terriglobus sp.]|uniref:sugar phosphate isomerase/epimerase family protein n=1 Tax=Terriglobus sp. TaxID=1889013 RepID=UPI003B00B122